MAVDILVPAVGESISEVVLSDWLVGEGEQVTQDQSLVTLETDKVNVEVPAPNAGVLLQILKHKGETARVGEAIARFEVGAAAVVTAPVAAAAKDPRVMPAAQRVLAQAGVHAEQVEGTGPGGRVTKGDASRYVQGQKIPLVYAEPPPSLPASPPSTLSRPAQGEPDVVMRASLPVLRDPVPLGRGEASSREVSTPMSPLRRRVAERLVQAQHTAAILTTFNEIDMTAVLALRKEHQTAFQARHGVKLGFMSFFIKACVDALKAFPNVNAEIRGTDVVHKQFWDLGVAIGGGKGLVVPVLRACDRLGFGEIEKALVDLGTRAKAGTLKLEDLQGGTFSISNGGVYGSMMSTPILNPPQSGILGMHAIIERPIALAGQVVIRPMMYIALSYDHRIVDGREAVGFLVRVKECVERPERLLLDI